jgi:transcription-repair coupling factor (superfamily II helicase)
MNRTDPLTAVKTLTGGAPEGYDAKLLADLVARTNGPVIHVLRDDTRLAAMQQALKFFAPDLPVLVFPAWDCLPFDRISPNAEVSARRMGTLAILADGFERASVVLTTLNAATQKIPPRAVVASSSFTAIVGKQINVENLRSYLVRMGFNQAPTVTEPGDYAIRGGLIDIFPPGASGPIRLDLFGDVLDGARRFEAATQRTIEKINRIELAPVSEVILDEESIQRFRSKYRHTFGAAGNDDPLYEAVSAGRKHQGLEHWLPFFHDHLDTLFDYLPNAPVVLDDQVTPSHHARWTSIEDQYETRHAALSEKSHLGTVYKPVEPALLYLDEDSWNTALENRAIRQLSPLPQPSGPNCIDAGGRIGRNFAPERQNEDISLFGALAEYIAQKRKSGNVVLCSYSEGSRERFATLLEDSGVENFTNIARFSDIGQTKGLFLTVWPLDTGFETPDLTVISEQDILGDRLIRAPRRRRAENFLKEKKPKA